MSVHYILQNDVFSEGLDRLAASIINNGDTYEVFKYKPFALDTIVREDGSEVNTEPTQIN